MNCLSPDLETKRLHVAYHPASAPSWQLERERLLHRVCTRVKARIEAGERKSKVLRRYGRLYNGKPFKTSRRRLRLSQKTLARIYSVWIRNGEAPSAFRLHFKGFAPTLGAQVLARFINDCAERVQPTMKGAWDNFQRKGCAFGRGRRPVSRASRASYWQMQYWFKAAQFKQLQQQLKTIERSKLALANLKFQFIAEIRRRLPDRPRRTGKEIDFQI